MGGNIMSVIFFVLLLRAICKSFLGHLLQLCYFQNIRKIKDCFQNISKGRKKTKIKGSFQNISKGEKNRIQKLRVLFKIFPKAK